MVGQTLGHYKILDKLGAGGMGEVYLAQDSVRGREVALKVLPEAFAKDKERLARLSKYIRPSEQSLIVELVRDYHSGALARRNKLRRYDVHLDLEALGRLISGYMGRAQAQAAGVARLQALLDIVGDFYDHEGKTEES